MSEEEKKVQDNENEVEVEVVDSEPNNAPESVETKEDELENYTKNVSKRINKLNERNRKTQEENALLRARLAEKDQENLSLRNVAVESQSHLLTKQEEALNAKQTQAEELYKKALASNDAELISKADTLKSELVIEKEKLRVAKQRAQQPQQVQQYQQDYQQQEPQNVQPTKEALDWYAKNSWYGDQSDENNMRATKYAYFQHNMLIDEGYEADSSEYYEELNNRIEQVYPNLKGNVDANVSEPAVQRVASASVGGRQKTQGSKKNGVTFSKSEVDRLRGLKPHNMSEEAWLKSVAKEKQKIDAREAK
jgi:hypothetical protein